MGLLLYQLDFVCIYSNEIDFCHFFALGHMIACNIVVKTER